MEFQNSYFGDRLYLSELLRLKPGGVIQHVDVVEHDAGRAAGWNQPGNLLQLRTGKNLLKIPSAMQAEINEAAGRDPGHERINDMHQIQFQAQRQYPVLRPVSAWFPKKRQPMSFNRVEETSHLINVGWRADETGGTLEQNISRGKRFGAGPGSFPCPQDRWAYLKRPALFQLRGREFGLQPAEGGAFGRVCDQLPRLQGEFKIGRHQGAPALQRGNPGWLIKCLLHFGDWKPFGVFDLGQREPAAAGFDQRRNH